MTSEVSKVLRLPRKMQCIFWKPSLKNCACHSKTSLRRRETRWNVTKCHACYAKWSHMRRWKAPKVTPFEELTIGTAIVTSCERLRTAMDGCRRLRTVAEQLRNGWATSGEHSSTPRPPEWNGNPCYAIGKNVRNLQAPRSSRNTRWSNCIWSAAVACGLSVSYSKHWDPCKRESSVSTSMWAADDSTIPSYWILVSH